jgi:site-specific DNA-methyltransferase (adenine-specific)
MYESIRLIHGDCIEEMQKMGDESVDFTLTDIPYDEVSRSGNGLRNLDKGKADILTFDLQLFLHDVYRITKNSVCVFCGKEQFSEIYGYFASKKGTTRPIVWEKSNPSPMNGEYVYLSGVEFAVWFKKSGAKTFNARCKNTVMKHPCGRSKMHPTEKNQKLLVELILDNSSKNQTVFDPCMGSGSTAIACINTDRNFIGIELDDGYFQVATDRIQQHTRQLKLID